MKKDLFVYLQYWKIKAHIHERYGKDFTRRQCKIVRSDFESGLKSFSREELKNLSSEIYQTKATLNLALEELNKRYKDRLRKEKGPFVYLYLSILDNFLTFLNNLFKFTR